MEQSDEIAEILGNFRMFGAVGMLIDGQGAAHQGLGLRQPVGCLQQRGKIDKCTGQAWVVLAEALLQNGQGTAH